MRIAHYVKIVINKYRNIRNMGDIKIGVGLVGLSKRVCEGQHSSGMTTPRFVELILFFEEIVEIASKKSN
jgi:hypothetical protein